MTDSMSLGRAQRWATMERQWYMALHHGKYKWFRCNIPSKTNYSLPFCSRMLATTLQQYTANDSQWSVNDFWHCILENARAVWRHQAMIKLSAAMLGKMHSTTLSTCPNNEHQRSINDFWPCILEYHGPMRLLWSILELLAARLGENASDDLDTML